MDKQSYQIQCIRYMCDLDVNGNAINWRAVPGKYEREFVQQCSADID